MKEDRQSSFPHIRRGFPQERKKNLPFERKSFSITTDQSCTRAGKNSIQSIFRNKPWKHTARCFIGAAIPTSTLRLTSVAFITCSRKAATLASSNENHRRNSLLSRLRCELYYSNLASSDAPFSLANLTYLIFHLITKITHRPFFLCHPRAHTYTAREQEKSIWISNKIWKL